MAKRVNVKKKFMLHTVEDGKPTYTTYEPGSHLMPDEHADHWYTKVHSQTEPEAKLQAEKEADVASDEAKKDAQDEANGADDKDVETGTDDQGKFSLATSAADRLKAMRQDAKNKKNQKGG